MLDPVKLSKFLWGNIYYNLETRKFVKVSSKDPDETPRSFVHFVLEPFYKLICLTLTSDKMALQKSLKFELGGIDKLFTKKEYDLDMQPLLKLVLGRYFGDGVKSFVD